MNSAIRQRNKNWYAFSSPCIKDKDRPDTCLLQKTDRDSRSDLKLRDNRQSFGTNLQGDDEMKRDRKRAPGFEFSIDESGATGILKLRGALTEQQVEEMGRQVESFNSNVSYFKLNFEHVTAVDQTSIQALYSTCERLGRLNKTLAMDGLCPVTFTSAVENMGLANRQWLCFGHF